MLHKPQDWKFTKQALLSELGQDGERSIQSGMKKLQELGYLEITRESRKKGKLARSIWTVRDVPQLQNAVMAKQSNEQTESGSPQLRYPSVQNAVDYKRKNNKKKTAVSAGEGLGVVEDIEFAVIQSSCCGQGAAESCFFLVIHSDSSCVL